MSRRNELDVDHQLHGSMAEQVMWSFIRTKPSFTIEQIWWEENINISKAAIIRFVSLLEHNEYVTRSKKFEKTGLFILARRGQAKLPKLNHPGHREDRSRALQNMWNTMRRLKDFNAKDIVACSNTPDISVSLNAATNYCRFLERANYLRVIDEGGKAKNTRYQLIDNTGPNAPVVRRETKLYDPNEQRVRYLEDL